MKLPRRNFLHLVVGAAALPAASRFAWAQAYPTRPVRLIVPVAPAGASDITARLIGQWLSERLGQQFVIDNRPGGGSNIGTEAVVRAPADGYTLLVVGSYNYNATNAALYDKLNFNFIRDIAPVAGAPAGTAGHLSGSDRATRCPTEVIPAAERTLVGQGRLAVSTNW
jgi:tripartite-type tricarboxylate transporter receptor subunit TctC